MPSPYRLIIPILALSLTAAAPYAVQLDARRCLPLSLGQVTELGPDWLALARYAQRCPVHGPNGRLALSVDIIRLDQAVAADYFQTRTANPVPMPVLRDGAGTAIGKLPDGFPVDPPGMLQVRFTNWRFGFPHQVRLHQAGESALAPHALPSMRWKPDVRRFE